jgi:hypothetical protein
MKVTSAGLVAELALTCAGSVPNLTRRFAAWSATDAKVRERLRCLKRELQVFWPLELT